MMLAVFIFAANYVIGRGVVHDVPPYMLGFTRWAGAALLLAPFTWRHVRRDRESVRRGWAVLAGCGFLMPFLGAGVAYVALTMTVAINAAVVQTSMPVMILLIAWIVLNERISALQAAGVAVALSGVAAIISRGDPAAFAGLSFNTGDVILLACNLGLAGYAVLIRRAPAVHPLTLLTVVCVVGAAFHAPFLAWEMLDGRIVRATATAAVGLVFVAVFPSIIAILLWNNGIRRLGPGRSGIYMYLMPVFTAALGYAFLGERVEGYHYAGVALIAGGVYLTARRPRAGAGASG